ncbi:MAG: histidine phosphatase family protein [Bacilli bacterium]
MKSIYLVKHSGPFVDIKNYEDYENVLWEDYNRNMILSVEGEKRAEKLCEIEELNNVERIFASDSVRAIASAKYLAEKNNIKIELDERINERIFGVETLSQLPNDFNKLSFDDKNYKMENGESFNDVDKRFVNFINDLLNQNNSSYILFIHGLILLSYLETICDFTFDGMNFSIKYKGKEILNGNPKSPSVYKIIYNDDREVIDVDII